MDQIARAIHVFTQAVCAMAEMEGMKATNKAREMRGDTLAYTEEAFLDIPNKYGIHHNSVVELLRD